MGVNNAENGVYDALVNEVARLRRDLDQFRTSRLQIGNGSIKYAFYGTLGFGWGAYTLNAGTNVTYSITLPVDSLDSYPAYNRWTLMDVFIDLRVDANDAAHRFPDASGVSAGGQKLIVSQWMDLTGSGLSETNGQRKIMIEVVNNDSAAHVLYLTGNALIPVPALRPT